MTTARSKDYELLDQLAEEFAERFRRGERPALADYLSRYPDLAEEIRELFPALVEVEQADADQPSRQGREPLQAVPSQIGDYRVLQEIGRGGMGVVYEAEQRSLGRRVALKVLPRSTTQESRAIERFRREARAAAKLHHTNIVPIFEIGQDGETHFYAMQFIQGQGLDLVLDELRRLRSISLGDGNGSEKSVQSNPHAPPLKELTQSLLHNRFDDGRAANDATEVFLGDGPEEVIPLKEKLREASSSSAPAFHLPGSEDLSRVEINRAAYFQSVARIGQQAAAALAHAHARGIVHRDIKPSNLLLDAAGVIWITDFGLAKIDDSNLTHSGDVVGTLRYMAPERFAGKSDPRSDLYGLGLTLYELLALRPAFEAHDRLKLIEQIRQQEPPRPRDFDPMVPEDLETIVLRAMDKDPERRYPSANALAEDLRRFLANESILARRIGPVERLTRWCRRNPLVAGLSGTVLGLIGVLAVVSMVAALWLNGALETSEGHRKRAEEAEAEVRANLAVVEKANGEKTKQLRESLVHQANAVRWSGRAGRRFESLAALAKAAQIHPNLELRNEAIASMALPDLRQVWALDHDPLTSTVVAWDANLDHYVVADRVSGDVSVRRFADHHEAARLPGTGTHAVYGKFSPDGRYLAVKYDNQKNLHFAVWDVGQAREVVRLPQGNTHHAFDFSPDGKRVAAATPDRKVATYDLETGDIASSFSTKERVYHLEFDPAGKHLALCLEVPGPIEIRDASTGTIVRAFASTSRMRCLTYNRHGDRLAAGGDDRIIRIWDLTKPTAPPTVLRGHHGEVVLVHFVPNSDLLVSSAWDRTTRLWDVVTGKEQVHKPGNVFHTDRAGRKLAATSPGSGAALWEIAGGDECRVVKGWGIGFDPQSPVAVVGSWQGMAALDLSVHHPSTYFGPPHVLVQFHPKERTLVSMPVDGQIGATWPIAENHDEKGRHFKLGPPRPWKLPVVTQHHSFLLSPDGRTVGILQRAWTPLLLDWESLQIKSTLSSLPGVANLSFSQDGKWIAGGTWQGKNVKVWEVETGRELIELPFPQTASVTFSPDGQSLAVNHAGETQLWETATWKMTRRIPKKSSDENHIIQAFSPDGTVLAITTTLGRVRLVNPKTGEEFATLEPPNQANPGRVLFDSSGGRVAVTNAIGLIHIWDLRAIRRQLKTMSLDWNLPDIATEPWENESPRAIRFDPGKQEK